MAIERGVARLADCAVEPAIQDEEHEDEQEVFDSIDRMIDEMRERSIANTLPVERPDGGEDRDGEADAALE